MEEVLTKLNMLEAPTDPGDIVVVVDMLARDIVEYCGYYDHDKVGELLDNIEENLELIEDDIIGKPELIKCNLVWLRGDQSDCCTTYLVMEYVENYAYYLLNNELKEDR